VEFGQPAQRTSLLRLQETHAGAGLECALALALKPIQTIRDVFADLMK
jgi:hypothetical protein